MARLICPSTSNFYQEDELGSDGRDHRPIAQFQENMNLLLMFSVVKVRD